jgi:glutathione S-transferase
MFFEQYSHEPYVAVLKFWTRWGGLHNKRPDEIALWKTRGQAALGVMSQHLRSHAWFTGERYGIADIALFAYTQSAAEIGYEIDAAIAAWLERVRAQPGFVPIRH